MKPTKVALLDAPKSDAYNVMTGWPEWKPEQARYTHVLNKVWDATRNTKLRIISGAIQDRTYEKS